MRKFYFKARNIGAERYLTYTLGEDCELDEDVLDYCEENKVNEIIRVIYEEDDDYDYLTYDITGKDSLEALMKDYVNCEMALNIMRNIAKGLIGLRERAINLSYILINRNFIYIDRNSLGVKFICIPIDTPGSVAAEFKGFARQLLANFKYDVDEDVSYVAKLLTYINGDGFTLRGLIELVEALMEDEGLEFIDDSAIEVDGQDIEVFSSDSNEVEEEDNKVSDFMSSLGDDEELPEIGSDYDEDDYDEDETDYSIENQDEIESILPTGLNINADNREDSESYEDDIDINDIDEAEESDDEVNKENQDDRNQIEDSTNKNSTIESISEIEKKVAPPEELDVIKNRIRQLVGEVPMARTRQDAHGETIRTLAELDEMLESRPPVIKRQTIKVNRAALIQNVADKEQEHAQEQIQEQIDSNSVEDSSHTVELIMSTEQGADIVKEETNDEATNIDKAEVVEEVKTETTKSGSILSKSFIETTKAATASLLGVVSHEIKAMPYLVRVNTEEIIMLNKLTFKIGKASRGVDYSVSGNGAISRQHAIITQKDGVCYIKDNKSTNHTYVNEKMVEDGEEELLTHESKIKLGDEEFVFKIR